MELLNDLKTHIRALEKVKVACLKEALIMEDFEDLSAAEIESNADVAAGQYVAYSSVQDTLIELVLKYEGEVEASA